MKKKVIPIEVDLHSHLIPNIDDGSQSMEQSLEMIRALSLLGVKKLITTPHIHPRYPNTPEIIMNGLKKLQGELQKKEIEIELEAAAEYYVDESFSKKVQDGGQILSFGNKYVLVEAPFQNKPIDFESVMFDLKSKGYHPVLAHPERYQFLEGSLDWLQQLRASGVLFQVTLGSISGYYGTIPAKLSSQLLKSGMVDFLGSDLHRLTHIEYFKKGLQSKEVQKVIESGSIKNAELL
ncbi:tyrosine-protein phosphatase [Ekhidna sp.]|uniref:tyrosine-protein phosphatase n=1 Tax=Ekhidna sp. TaxID=2608089 RepID=UPI003BA87748